MIGVKIFAETMGQAGDDMFKCDKNAGRGMHFIVNGWCLSAQAGWGNYCSADPSRSHCKLTHDTIRHDCEIALWKAVDNATNMIKLDSDTVMGWVKWDMVFDIIQWLRKQKDIPTEKQVRSKVLDLRKYYDKEE